MLARLESRRRLAGRNRNYAARGAQIATHAVVYAVSELPELATHTARDSPQRRSRGRVMPALLTARLLVEIAAPLSRPDAAVSQVLINNSR
jgi:hypothetical protein